MTATTAATTGKSPCYPMYPRDFLADVLLLSDTEELLYRRLLDYQWLHGEVPSDAKDRALAARMPKAKADKAWGKVAPYFPWGGPLGGVQNRRMEEIRKDQSEARERRSAAGSRGNEKRWDKAPSSSQCDPNARPERSPAVAVAVAVASAVAVPTTAGEAVFLALPPDSHEALRRLCRSSGNPDGILDELARIMVVHPKVIPTGAGMRGESPAIVGGCLIDLANHNRPTWNPLYFRGMIETAKAKRVPRGTATESPGEALLRKAAEQDKAA